jgi:hypothetical protein
VSDKALVWAPRVVAVVCCNLFAPFDVKSGRSRCSPSQSMSESSFVRERQTLPLLGLRTLVPHTPGPGISEIACIELTWPNCASSIIHRQGSLVLIGLKVSHVPPPVLSGFDSVAPRLRPRAAHGLRRCPNQYRSHLSLKRLCPATSPHSSSQTPTCLMSRARIRSRRKVSASVANAR